ncbi:MAG: tRNA dihydrouridine(20/20a) synthase DusA [Halocynthiibacter sp.]
MAHDTPSSMNTALSHAAKLSVAPMMDWTDRHCRYFHRRLSREALLYTEMVTAPALVRGGAVHLLEFDPSEQPLAVQLGGSDPRELATATKLCWDAGYHEVNLNVGCPSDRVQSGAFGAVLMKSPDLVAECVSDMIAASPAEITVKCRIGVDDQEPHDVLPAFLEKIRAAGVKRITIHARKAWLQGLSPKENRDVPPLDYPLVHQMKRDFPDLHLSINGGIATLEDAQTHLDAGMDGVMIGRAAYHTPAEILQTADQLIFKTGTAPKSAHQIANDMIPYIERHIANGGRMNGITRHMLGLFAGKPGARRWRRHLSEHGHGDAGIGVFKEALSLLG